MWNKNLKVIVLALTVDEDVLYIFWYPNSSKVFPWKPSQPPPLHLSSEPQKKTLTFHWIVVVCITGILKEYNGLWHSPQHNCVVFHPLLNQWPFFQNAKLCIFESPKSRMASVHQVECHAPSRRAPSTLGWTAHQTTHQTYQNHVIRVTPLATHNISVTIMCVLLQHVFYSETVLSASFGKVYIRNYVLHKGSSWEKLLGGWFSCVWKP